jgi:hypothetical protein
MCGMTAKLMALVVLCVLVVQPRIVIAHGDVAFESFVRKIVVGNDGTFLEQNKIVLALRTEGGGEGVVADSDSV